MIYQKGFPVINFLGCWLIAPKSCHIFENQPLLVPGILAKMNKFSEICGEHPTNTSRVFHVETSWKRSFSRHFNVEYTWHVCKEHVHNVFKVECYVALLYFAILSHHIQAQKVLLNNFKVLEKVSVELF